MTGQDRADINLKKKKKNKIERGSEIENGARTRVHGYRNYGESRASNMSHGTWLTHLPRAAREHSTSL